MTDRRLTALLSLTAADALAAATEFKTPQAIRQRYGDTFREYREGSVFGFAPGEATDDSQMVAATLLGYARAEELSDAGLSGVLEGLRDWLSTRPPDVGGLTRAALGYGTLDGGVRAWADSGFQSAGNGGLMRIAGVWLAGFSGEDLARQSVLVTALTHADPRCVYASVFFTGLLEALGQDEPLPRAAAHGLALLDTTDARAIMLDAGLFGLENRAAFEQFAQASRPARQQVRERVRSGLDGHLTSQSGYVLDTLEAALAHARSGDWLACTEPAALLGDDSDTVACVTGAIAGARGLAVPEHLLPQLRLGHSWPGWQREWSCLERLPELLGAAQRAAQGHSQSAG
ncbi:ADP-ribosylation/Crystallin J1 [Deinococcus proteolyticus MRP]|uniref:ADP-ribosylation/Crystallin J1 n=1 Tax=Deinococcus proteolyticus (strain ATCC 35074 / DSM 20540 / JCM 6276 / NBRC 101906 / NCIMB 13154 / VKM Ac-1939 / CCM 2703 / MRP) TaxID=693977 RepID=F0RLK1_DEIPM|nr:ADP-ribosylglycohydrolase family protein [Deinococcus proteolyticus]ADY26925.1 ADP-ribosylation/Crystallin J1 [Deinococcus proteolyticus MRP]